MKASAKGGRGRAAFDPAALQARIDGLRGATRPRLDALLARRGLRAEWTESRPLNGTAVPECRVATPAGDLAVSFAAGAITVTFPGNWGWRAGIGGNSHTETKSPRAALRAVRDFITKNPPAAAAPGPFRDSRRGDTP